MVDIKFYDNLMQKIVGHLGLSPDLVRHLLDNLFSNGEEMYIFPLKAAILSGKHDDIKATSHKLKGALSLFCLEEINIIVEEIHSCAMNKQDMDYMNAADSIDTKFLDLKKKIVAQE